MNLFIQYTDDGHFGDFQLLAIMEWCYEHSRKCY